MKNTVTLKSINANLPRLDTLRRDYAPAGTTGIVYWRLGYLRAAIADVDEARQHVTDITIYTYSDAMKADHYHGGGIDITEQIEDALKDPDITRKQLTEAIQTAIKSELDSWDLPDEDEITKAEREIDEIYARYDEKIKRLMSDTTEN